LNLGRKNCPDRTQLEQAFVYAGADDAASFLTNGTVVFSLRSGASAARLLTKAATLLEAACGMREPGFVRPLAYLAELVAAKPFDGVDRSTVHECCVSFLHPKATVPADAVRATPRGDVQVMSFTGGEAFSLSRKLGKSPGSPNAFIERMLGLPATTRNWNT